MTHLKSVLLSFGITAVLAHCLPAEGQTVLREEKINSLFIQSTAGSNTGSFGAFVSEIRQPSVSGTISYLSPLNFDLGITQFAIGNSDDSLEHTTWETDLTAGYKLQFARKFYIYASYLHAFYSSNSSLLRARYSNQASLELGYEGSIWNPCLSGSFLAGEKQEFLFDVQNFFQLELDHFPFRRSTLTLLPAADLMLGKLQFYNEYLLEQYQRYPRLFLYYYRVRKGMTRQQIEDILTTEKRFTISSLSLSLPATISIGNWMLSGSFNAVKSFNQPEIIGNPWVFYLTGSVGYAINWKKGGRFEGR